MVVILFSALMMVSFSHAESDSPHSVKGKIEFEETVKGGDVYIFIAPQGGSFLAVETSGRSKEPEKLEKGAKVPAPDLRSRWVSVGRKSGKSISFDVSLKNGRYQLGCIVKRSQPDCTEVTVNDERIISQCFPGKEDSICDQRQVEVSGRNIYDLSLRVGVTETEKP